MIFQVLDWVSTQVPIRTLSLIDLYFGHQSKNPQLFVVATYYIQEMHNKVNQDTLKLKINQKSRRARLLPLSKKYRNDLYKKVQKGYPSFQVTSTCEKPY